MDRDQTMRANYMAAENVIIQDLGDRSDDELSEQESPTAVASVVQANTTVHHLNISNTDNITFPDGKSNEYLQVISMSSIKNIFNYG